MSFGQKVSGTGVTRYEKVEVTDGGDGKWHYIDRQNLGHSCGPACVRMVVKMVTDKLMGEAYMAGLITVAELGSTPSDTNPLAGTTAAAHDFDTAGSAAPELVKALKDCKVSKAREANPATAAWGPVFSACSLKAPAIIRTVWQGGGGAAHFVVIAGPLAGQAGKILVLDPYYGVQQLDLATPTVYTPRQGGGSAGLVLATGDLGIDPAGAWVDVVLTN